MRSCGRPRAKRRPRRSSAAPRWPALAALAGAIHAGGADAAVAVMLVLAVLAGIELTVAPGEHVGVTGVSGAGKSSLLHLAARLAAPTAGRVTLGGADIAGLRRAELAARIGYLTQRSELFADTVAANLRLARPEAPDAALWAALATADLDGFVAGLDDGLQTWVGESGARLAPWLAGRTVLAAAHEREALPACDRWLRLDHGRLGQA